MSRRDVGGLRDRIALRRIAAATADATHTIIAMNSQTPAGPAIATIGHSARPLEELVAILKAHGVSQLVDVRKMPRSRKNPQFNIETLPAELEREGIVYAHMPGLAGLRRRGGESLNTAWRNASFRAYADYMQTPEFDASLDDLIALSRNRATAIMCAEAVPWRCHRSLVADALVARGIEVRHLMSPTKANPHVLRDFARIEGARVSYPAQE